MPDDPKPSNERPSRKSLPSGVPRSGCPSCGHIFAERAAECPQCGHPLSTAFPAARGSRASFTPASPRESSERMTPQAPAEPSILPLILIVIAVIVAGTAGAYFLLM